MEDETEIYEYYVGKRVRVTKVADDGRKFFYNGKVTKLINNKLILDDHIIGRVIFSFAEIKLIELISPPKEGSKNEWACEFERCRKNF